jgi:hypothetical protein
VKTGIEKMTSGEYRRFVRFPFPDGRSDLAAHVADRYCACGQAVRVSGPERAVREFVGQWMRGHEGPAHELLSRREFERRRKALYSALGWGRYGRRRSVARQVAA